jgi:hypothetical protein
MSKSGATTTLKVNDLVRLMPWVEVRHANRYWTSVGPNGLSHCKTLVFRVLRFDDDGIHGLYAQLGHGSAGQQLNNVASFWVKTCLLTLASDPELV